MDTIGGVASSLQVGILSELVEIALPLLTPVGWPWGCAMEWGNERMNIITNKFPRVIKYCDWEFRAPEESNVVLILCRVLLPLIVGTGNS